MRFRVELVKARRARDAVVATQHLGLPAGDASLGQVARFDLARLVDSDGLPSVRRGRYLVRATPVGAAGPPVESEDFPVRLLTAHRLATDYLHGLTHLGAEVLSPKYQPRAIAGVEIIEVQPNTQPGFYPLSCNVDASGQRTLKWAGGTTIAIDPRFRRFVLPDNRDGYVEVEIADPQALPDASVEERILIERSGSTPRRSALRRSRRRRSSTPRCSFLEPTLLSTDGRRCGRDRLTRRPPYASTGTTWSRLTFYVQPAGKWTGIRFPYANVTQVLGIVGRIAGAPVMSLPRSWINCRRRSVRADRASHLQAAWPLHLPGRRCPPRRRRDPSFWRFAIRAGLRECPATSSRRSPRRRSTRSP